MNIETEFCKKLELKMEIVSVENECKELKWNCIIINNLFI